MGGKTSTSSSQVSIPPEVLARYNAVNANAEKVAKTPFQPYSNDPNAFVAPLNQQQIAGMQNINQSAGAAQPYYGAATRMTAAGAAPTNIGNVSGQDIGQYMNPYVQGVVNPAAQLLNQQQQAQMSSQTGQAMQQGAFGGDRSNLAAANLAGQQGLAFSNAINPLFSQGYTQALGAAQQQQGFQLGQQQQNLARMGQAGQQLAGIGTAAQGAGLQGAQAQMAAGQIGQQTEQAGKSALYNQFQQQQSYPFQTAQFLANIAEGTGALSGSTTTTQQPQSFFSDERVKEGVEDIGRTHDGQKIVKFRYKGEKGPKQIGLIAQDVEKHHPDAVGEYHGIKTVDYDKATKDAASMGGAVEPQHAGLGFAGGGLVGADDWNKLRAAQQQMWAGNGQTITGGMPHGGKGLNFPAPGHVASLAVAKTPSEKPKTGVQQVAGGLSDAAKGVTDATNIKKGYDAAKEAWDGDTSGGDKGTAAQAIAAPAADVDPEDIAQGLMARGGYIHRADGGDTDAPEDLYPAPGGLTIPDDNPHAKLEPAKAPGASGSGGSDAASAMQAAAAAAKLAMMFMAHGGSVEDREHHYSGGLVDGRMHFSGRDGSSVIDEPGLNSSTLAGIVPSDEAAPVEGPPKRDADLVRLAKNTTTANDASAPGRYDAHFEEASRATGIPVSLLKRQAMVESTMDPNAVGKSGEIGLHQIMPSTARDPGFGMKGVDPATLTGPENVRNNIMFGANYLKARGERAGVKDWTDPAQAAVGLKRYNGGGDPRYTQKIVGTNGDALGAIARQAPANRAPAGTTAYANGPASEPSSQGKDGFFGGLGKLSDDIGGWYDRNEKWLNPVMQGLGAMATSNSRYLGSALLQGLGAGAQAHTNLQEKQANIANVQAGTEGKYANIANTSIKTEGDRTFIRAIGPNGYYWVPFNEWWAIEDPAKRPQIDPRDKGAIAALIAAQGQNGSAGRGTTTNDAGLTAPNPAKVTSSTLSPPVANQPSTGLGAAKPVQPPAGAAAGTPTTTATPTDFSLSPEEKQQAMSLAQLKSGWSPTRLKEEPNYFKPQDAMASNVAEQRQLVIPLAGALASLPKNSSIKASGKLQEVLTPIVSVVNNIAAIAGIPGINTAGAATVEDINKLVRQLQASNTPQGQHAYAAFKDTLETLPTNLNSPGGQARLVPQLLTNMQRIADKNGFFVQWNEAAGGLSRRNSEWSWSTSREANRAFDEKYSNAFYAKERANLERMFGAKPEDQIDSGKKDKFGKPIGIPVMQYLAEHAADLNGRQKKDIETKYGPGILRYFGVR